mgnify:CR=1 FL=1
MPRLQTIYYSMQSLDILGIIIQMKRRALYMIDDDEIIVDEELAEYFEKGDF